MTGRVEHTAPATLPRMQYASIVDRVRGLGGDMWAVHTRAAARRAAGEDIILLTLGEPDFPTPPGVIDAAINAMNRGRTKYSSGRGEPNLRAAVAAKYAARTGRPVGPEDVVFLPGTQTALCLTMMTLAEAGDDVLVPEPYYATYRGVLATSGARIVPVPLSADDGFHLRPETLEAASTPNSRALLLNSPHNPTGATLTRAEIEAISEVCVELDLWVVSDEVYDGLVYSGEFASPFDLDHMVERTVVVSSLSKSHAMTGWRCGWAVGTPEFINNLLPVSESMLFGSQPFLQDAAAAALLEDFGEVHEMRASYARRAWLVVDHLADVEGVVCTMPDAGIFVMLDVRASGVDGLTFAERLLDEEGVAVMPGESFGPSAAGHVRLSVVADGPTLEEACARIRRFAKVLTAAR